MLHKIVPSSLRSENSTATPNTTQTPRLTLVPATPQPGAAISPTPTPFFDLLTIAAPKCSSFLAEAAVLVLVFALLDRILLKGRMEVGWVVSAIVISLLLLAASIATEFSARRWLRTH